MHLAGRSRGDRPENSRVSGARREPPARPPERRTPGMPGTHTHAHAPSIRDGYPDSSGDPDLSLTVRPRPLIPVARAFPWAPDAVPDL